MTVVTKPGTGGSAFPQAWEAYPGMTLRDWFAGQALAGRLLNHHAVESLPVTLLEGKRVCGRRLRHSRRDAGGPVLGPGFQLRYRLADMAELHQDLGQGHLDAWCIVKVPGHVLLHAPQALAVAPE